MPEVHPTVAIVGLVGGTWFGPDAERALTGADVVVGARRQLDDLAGVVDLTAETVELAGPLDEVLDLVETERARGRSVTLLASGDPGFFGIERLIVGRFGATVDIHPAPSSIALAFARARMPWDDAAVVSVHGRSLDLALAHILESPKVAILVSASTPPEAVGRALIAADAPHRHATVCSKLGDPDETIVHTDLDGLAAGAFDPLSVLILTADPRPVAPEAVLEWGRPVAAYRHRASMITKPEVRAAALSALDLFGAAVMWDVGSASGSVAIEAARLAPGCRVYAVERDADDADRIRDNAGRVAVSVVTGEAPAAFVDLPDPDRVFVGGGGIAVVEAAAARLRPSGIIAATFATIDAAIAAKRLLGEDSRMVQIAVNRAVPIGPDGALRLEADNPVFLVVNR
ncbi:MAG: precorrin-6y C5,15-methyltransferase (decarboxylating) subunit CbiE [Actinomycetota bacterium]